MADEAAHRIFRGTSNTQAYLQWKRMEIYKAALIGALTDQQITQAEKQMLEALRKKLELSESDTQNLMSDLQAEMKAAKGQFQGQMTTGSR